MSDEPTCNCQYVCCCSDEEETIRQDSEIAEHDIYYQNPTIHCRCGQPFDSYSYCNCGLEEFDTFFDCTEDPEEYILCCLAVLGLENLLQMYLTWQQ